MIMKRRSVYFLPAIIAIGAILASMLCVLFFDENVVFLRKLRLIIRLVLFLTGLKAYYKYEKVFFNVHVHNSTNI